MHFKLILIENSVLKGWEAKQSIPMKNMGTVHKCTNLYQNYTPPKKNVLRKTGDCKYSKTYYFSITSSLRRYKSGISRPDHSLFFSPSIIFFQSRMLSLFKVNCFWGPEKAYTKILVSPYFKVIAR